MWEKLLLELLVISIVSHTIQASDLIPKELPSIIRCQAFPLGSRAFLIRWDLPSDATDQLIGYKISYKASDDNILNERKPPIQEPYVNQTKLTGLKPKTNYQLYIAANTRNGTGESCNIEKRTKADGTDIPSQPTFIWELLPLKNDFLRVKIIWWPNVDGNPGTDFFVKYRLKGKQEWTTTKRIVTDDFVTINGLSPKDMYEFIVVSVDGEFETESVIVEITRGLENPTTTSFINTKIIIGITALVLSLVLGFSIFKVVAHKNSKCKGRKSSTFDSSNPDSNRAPIPSKLDIWNDDFKRAANNYAVHSQRKLNLSSEQKLNSSYCLANFEEGNIDGINPGMMLDEQADLLPYDRKFEFPRENLELGQQLGAGAFGVVFKATAKGILTNEEETIVAVKMLKSIASDEILRALALELKILVYLGKHLNVVNLLGAITKNIPQRELMLIVEYCPHGNLQSYLIKNRQYFVDQLNRQEDRLDRTITYRKEISNDCGYVPFEGVQPVVITTTDLLCWSFQIARGMHYLAYRKVLHGDLAARNILLCENNVVKICDFGLARSMYKTGDYHIKTERALPFKWLALESISDQVFSTYSDVWSFGIVLWELFSLGATPYPGMIAGADLFQKLKDGYRMEKPEYATQEIYDIMLSCWKLVPKSRPLFHKLEEKIIKMIDKSVSEYYIVMNEQYLKENVSGFIYNQTDYIALLGSPNCKSPPIPQFGQHSQNSEVFDKIEIG